MYEEHEEKAALLQSSTVKAHNNNAYNPANQGNTYSDDDAQNNDGYNPANQGNTFSDDDADGEQDDIDTDDIIVPKYDDFVPKEVDKSLGNSHHMCTIYYVEYEFVPRQISISDFPKSLT
eukprot:377334_1